MKRCAAIAGFAIGSAIACARAPRPPDPELYLLVLSAVRSQLGLDSVVFIHPLLVLLGSGEREREFRLTDFNAFDSTSVPRILELDSTTYRPCVPGVTGACPLEKGETAVVLSDVWEKEDNGIGVFVFVSDGRPGRDYQQQYLVRLRRGFTRWAVVEFRRIG